jgi:hypothetical protein
MAKGIEDRLLEVLKGRVADSTAEMLASKFGQVLGQVSDLITQAADTIAPEAKPAASERPQPAPENGPFVVAEYPVEDHEHEWVWSPYWAAGGQVIFCAEQGCNVTFAVPKQKWRRYKGVVPSL